MSTNTQQRGMPPRSPARSPFEMMDDPREFLERNKHILFRVNPSRKKDSDDLCCYMKAFFKHRSDDLERLHTEMTVDGTGV